LVSDWSSDVCSSDLCYILFLDHNAEFNNTETSQMPYTHRDLSHIASEIT